MVTDSGNGGLHWAISAGIAAATAVMLMLGGVLTFGDRFITKQVHDEYVKATDIRFRDLKDYMDTNDRNNTARIDQLYRLYDSLISRRKEETKQ